MPENDSKFYKLPTDLARRKDLTSASKLLWAVLADRMRDNGYCWPGVRTLVEDTGLDVKTVLRATKELEDAGRLKVERRGSGRVNFYHLLIDESAGEMGALEKEKRWRNSTTGAGEKGAQALEKLQHNKTDELNRLSDAVRLAELLFSEIQNRKPDYRKPDLRVWAKHIDRMIRLDKRKPERIEAVIRWTQQDTGNGQGFGWANNILSTAKLREKFDRLELDMQKRPGRQAVAPLQRGLDGLTPRERALKELRND